MSTTVVLASFMHESNTFVEHPEMTTRDDFRDQWEHFGDDVVPALRTTETSVGGAIECASERDVDLCPILAARATPGAPVEQATYEFYVDTILDGVREHVDDLDGILLALHGAMVATHLRDGEGSLVRNVREVVGPEIPISVTLDLHGNITQELVSQADSLVAYKQYPHLDKAATGRLGMGILLDTIVGQANPTMHVERPPQIIFQPRAYTLSGPMKDVMDSVRAHESKDGVLGVSVLPGYYHADVPEMGVATIAITDDDGSHAKRIARSLAETLWTRRRDFVDEYPGPDAAVAEAKRLMARSTDHSGPVVMGDFGSNPGGGGASDGTTIPRAFLEQAVPNAGYALMYDPEVVEQCIAAGVGAELTVTLGGKTDENHGEPITDLDVYVKAITDGRYVNTGTSHSGQGIQNDLGPTVHIECGTERDLHVIVSGIRASAFDAEIWRHIGIQPERLNVLCIPSFIAFLGDYESLASDIVLADTPGVSAVDPARFEYEHIPRPIYPLDPLDDDHYPAWST